MVPSTAWVGGWVGDSERDVFDLLPIILRAAEDRFRYLAQAQTLGDQSGAGRARARKGACPVHKGRGPYVRGVARRS